MPYIAERIIPIPIEATRAYSTLLDVRAFRNLLSQKELLQPEKFARKLSELHALTRHNVETSLGERFNVELSKEGYQITNHLIFHPSYEEPFIEVIRRGQEYRWDNGSNDTRRENAEGVGFEKVQDLLTRPNVPSDEKIIVISPKGSQDSIYQHNFYDVYQKGQASQITMSRFTCKFSYDQFYEAAQMLDSLTDLPENPNDSDFLSSPLITYKSLVEINQTFSPQEDTMSQPEYAKLIEACALLINDYISNLSQNPQEYDAEKEYYRILRFACVYTGIGPQTYDVFARRSIIEEIRRPILLPRVALTIDRQTLSAVKTGCGISGQISSSFKILSLTRPFSVADFSKLGRNIEGEDDEEVIDFQCPGIKADGTKCTYIVRAYSGVRKCPQCGTEATCA